MDDLEKAHILHGRSLLRLGDGGDDADLKGNPALWAELWKRYRLELLPDWIERHPGERPAAWIEFDCPEERAEDETIPEFLDRLGLIKPDELEAIADKARGLVKYNRARHGKDPRSNYIPPDDTHRLVMAKGLLTPEEVEILSREYLTPEEKADLSRQYPSVRRRG
jgi:hypothetical protein